jgi:hypothetical protein
MPSPFAAERPCAPPRDGGMLVSKVTNRCFIPVLHVRVEALREQILARTPAHEGAEVRGVRSRGWMLVLCLACPACGLAEPGTVKPHRPAPRASGVISPVAPTASSAGAPIPSASAPTAPTLVRSAPVPIGNYPYVRQMVLFESAVYFVGSDSLAGAVLKAPVDGGKQVSLDRPLEDPDGVAPTRTGVYYHDDSSRGVFRIPPSGGKRARVAEADDGSLGGDGGRAVWSHGGDLYMAEGTRPVKLASGVGVVGCPVADAEAIYWFSQERRAIEQLRPPRRQAERVAGGANVGSLALDATHIYYLEAGVLKRVRKAGGAPEVLLVGRDRLAGVAVDGAHAYVTAAGSGDGAGVGRGMAADGSILRVPVSGGPAEVVAAGLALLGGIAVDAGSLYFSVTGDGHGQAIVKLPKP